MTATITPEKKLTIIKHLAAGKSADVVSAIVSIPRNDIVALASGHGYPDVAKLGWAADILEKNLTQEETDAIPEASRETARVLRDQPPHPTPIHRDEPRTAPAHPDEIRVLLNAAKAAKPKRIQGLANKIFDQLDQLRALLDEENEKRRVKSAEEQARSAARAEVERLEKQLAAARARLRGKPTTPATVTPATGPAADTREATHECDGCGKKFTTAQGRTLHKTRQHGPGIQAAS